MKRLLGFALAVVLVATVGLHATATNTPTYTPTPNATLTQAAVNIQATQTAVAATATYVATAYPTLTPTLTPTGTLTPSPTPTAVAKSGAVARQNARERVYILPSDFLSSAGTGLATLAQDGNGLSYFNFGATSATVRAQWKVPQDFKGDFALYANAICSATAGAVTVANFTVNVNGFHLGLTTATAGTYSYYVPGGAYSYAGSTTNVVVSQYSQDALYPGVAGQYTPLFSRVYLPIPYGVNAYTSGPIGVATALRPGDIVNFSIEGFANSGSIWLYGLELSYDYYWDTNQ